MLKNIICRYDEYRKDDRGRWVRVIESSILVDSAIIQSMVDAGYYFSKQGGVQEINMFFSKRFGMQVRDITCISACGTVRKKYIFSYKNAREVV